MSQLLIIDLKREGLPLYRFTVDLKTKEFHEYSFSKASQWGMHAVIRVNGYKGVNEIVQGVLRELTSFRAENETIELSGAAIRTIQSEHCLGIDVKDRLKEPREITED